MTPRLSAVGRVLAGGLARRRVQAAVVGLVTLISTAACVLAIGLVVASNSPFDRAFATQHGAHAVVTVETGQVTTARLMATGRLPEVTASSGPFPEVTVTPRLPGPPGSGILLTAPPSTLVGRAAPSGRLDDLTLKQGRWVQRPGEVVLSSAYPYGLPLGSRISVSGIPGTPRLTLVGIANSVNQSADGWVVPAEIAALRPPGAPPAAQMLYRFADAKSAAAIRADVAALRRVLPAGAIAATQSYLAVKIQEMAGIAPIVPFVITFGVIGLALSVLIVINVAGATVAAGYQRIGVLKSIGFTPGQVVAACTGQVLIPAMAGCVAGVLLGNLLAVPVLARTANVYGVGALAVPWWVDAGVPAAMCCLAGIAALAPAVRGGRLSAVQAIAAGRAPAAGRGYLAHRLLGRVRLPRPVTIGLAAPFGRPARTAAALVAIGFGVTAVTFAIGLSTSLGRVADGISRARAVPVQILLSPDSGPGAKQPGPGVAAKALPRAIEAALQQQPGTLRYVAEADQQVSVTGLSEQVLLTAFRGDASWTGYNLIDGRWFTGPGQVDVPTNFLTMTGTAIGDTVTVNLGRSRIRVRIVGEVFDPGNNGIAMLTDWRTLADAGYQFVPAAYDVALRPGTVPAAYAGAVSATLGPGYPAAENVTGNDPFLLTLIGLIATLTLLLAAAAGLGVLNTVVMYTRERVHDLAVFKSVGMTPRQIIIMVICWVTGPGLIAGVLAVPAGMVLHARVLPVMASAAGTGLPASYLNVYGVLELAVLALSGPVIAAAGAMLPAGWAARARAATALHTE